jgi:hypothetical protein
MLVADGRGNQVRILDRDGKVLGHWGEKGTEPGQFGLPHVRRSTWRRWMASACRNWGEVTSANKRLPNLTGART